MPDEATDETPPGPWGRLMARLQGEIPATELEAYRRAGAEVYSLLDDLEGARAEWALAGLDAWTAPHSTQVALLCGWNAFALQAMGDQLLSADYESEPSTRGYVPPVTAEQVLAWYEQVPAWLSRSRAARESGTYALDVAVPAALPPWSEVEPCPRPHLAAIRAAAAQLRRHATASMAGFHVELTDPGRKRAHDRVHEVLAEAEAAADYADRLWAPGVPAKVHEAIETHAKRSVEAFHLLGQLMAIPSLATAPPPKPSSSAGRPRPGPGQAGFDPWVLTDPRSRSGWKRDPEAREAISVLWDRDPDPRRTLAVQAEIDAAVERSDIVLDKSIGNYFCCPWSGIYLVRRPVTIDGRPLQAMQQFAFEVSAEEMDEGGRFKRELVVGRFHPTDEVDYCIPGRGHE